MRFAISLILIMFSIVAPLSAGTEGSADPLSLGETSESASLAPERLTSNYAPATVALFRANCVDCHDPDGRGNGGRELTQEIPDFTDLRWQGTRADLDLRRSILEGKGRSMPAMRAKIKPDDAVRLVALVRGFGGGRLVIPDQSEKVPGPARPVEPAVNKIPDVESLPSRTTPEASRREVADGVYRQSCRKCHGDDGKGDPLRGLHPGIPDFTNRRWQEGKSKAQLAASILEGKSTHMPAFRSKLGTTKVDELVAYVRAFVPSHRDSFEPRDDDFDRRLNDLQKEFDELRRAYRELATPPRVH